MISIRRVPADYGSSYLANVLRLYAPGCELITAAIQAIAAGGEVAASPQEPITHSNRFVLVDAAGRIRGYYDPFAPGGLEDLAADLTWLSSQN